MADPKTIDPRLVAKIVSSYVSHNRIAAGELPNLIGTIHHSRQARATRGGHRFSRARGRRQPLVRPELRGLP